MSRILKSYPKYIPPRQTVDAEFEFTVIEPAPVTVQNALVISGETGGKVTVDWGDGSIQTYTLTSENYGYNALNHTYQSAGVYTVLVTSMSNVTRLGISYWHQGQPPGEWQVQTPAVLTAIRKYRVLTAASLEGVFYTAVNMRELDADFARSDFGSAVNSLQMTFSGWSSFNQPLSDTFLSGWDTFDGTVFGLTQTFAGWTLYNQPLPDNFLRVFDNIMTYMESTFSNWSSYNQPLPERFFDNAMLRNKSELRNVFYGWRAFNQPLSQYFYADATGCPAGNHYGMLQYWQSYTQPLPVTFLKGGREAYTGLEYFFSGWAVYNQPLPENFMYDFPNLVTVTGLFSGWAAFNQVLRPEFMTLLPKIDSYTSVFRGWLVYNQDLPSTFMRGSSVVRYMGYAFENWHTYDKPLPAMFLSDTSNVISINSCFSGWHAYNQPFPRQDFLCNLSKVTSGSNLLEGWRSFNQDLPPSGFLVMPLNTGFTSICMGWSVFNKPLPSDFMTSAAIASGANFAFAFSGWYEFNQELPDTFMSDFGGRAFYITSLGNYSGFQNTFAGWHRFNKPLPSKFMRGIKNASRLNYTFSEWYSFNQSLPPQFMEDTEPGEYSRIEQCMGMFRHWSRYAQPALGSDTGTGFLGGFTGCTDFSYVMLEWPVYQGTMPVLPVASQVLPPRLREAFKENGNMRGDAGLIYGQRTDWPTDVTPSPQCAVFYNCSELTNLDSIPAAWKGVCPLG